jgi:DNA-binding transcriptional LysR family regulator
VPLTNNYIETLSLHVIRAHLQVSDCIAVMADTSARDTSHPQPLYTLPLSLPRLLRPAGVLWNRARTLTPSAKLMISCLEETAGRLAEEGRKNASGP